MGPRSTKEPICVRLDPSTDLPAIDPALFPAALMRAIGFDAVLSTEPTGVAVVRYLARPDHAPSDGRVVFLQAEPRAPVAGTGPLLARATSTGI